MKKIKNKPKFDSISLDHIENCLKIYNFPDVFTEAFMRLARDGTVQFEVNNLLSWICTINKGTGQGDPKSSFGFNIGSLRNSPVAVDCNKPTGLMNTPPNHFF